MQRDAEAHAEEDKKKRELADLHNQADHEVWGIEKLMKEAGDKISDSDKAPVNAAIAKLREVGKGTDKDAIQRAIQNLQQAAHALGQHIQRSGGGPSPEGRLRAEHRAAAARMT